MERRLCSDCRRNFTNDPRYEVCHYCWIYRNNKKCVICKRFHVSNPSYDYCYFCWDKSNAHKKNSFAQTLWKLLILVVVLFLLSVIWNSGILSQGAAALGTVGVSAPFAKNCTATLQSGECSSPKPFYCDDGKIVRRSDICGCPVNWRPNETNCAYAFPCPDGTLTPDCSTNKPYQCVQGQLVENASLCGCPEDYKTYGDTCIKIQRCNDRTIYGECSANQPLFCDNGTLVEKASQCGCSSDLYVTGEQCADPRPSFAKISAIYISDRIINELNSKFLVEKDEFQFCLYGRRLGENLIITDASEPNYQFRSPMLHTADRCPSNSWGFIHSHPVGNCMLSDGDKDILSNEGFPIQGTICETNRFAIYTVGNSQNTVQIIRTTLDGQNNPTNSVDITPKTPCSGEMYCLGRCWIGCSSPYEIWKCTPSGGLCEGNPNNCPPGQQSCSGRCWTGCTSQGTWTCTSTGGMCVCNPGIVSCSV